MALLSFVLSLTACLPLSSVATPQEWVPISCYGIWDRDGRFVKADRPFLRGKAAILKWYEVESSEGNLSLAQFNDSLYQAISMGECWYAMVHVGPDSPDWIYKQVPNVEVEKDTKHTFKYPYYLDAKYRELWFRMLKAVAAYIRGLPSWMTAQIGFIQVTTGCTGDEVAYKQPPLKAEYEISDAQWDSFRLEAFDKFREYFQTGSGRPLPLLFNEVDETDHPTLWSWLFANITQGLGIKGSAYVRGHHLTGESTWISTFRKYMINPAPGDPLIFTRAEMDQSYQNKLFGINMQLGIYWGVLSGLNQGLAVHDVSFMPVDNAYKWGIADSYDFFNKYAGQIYPQTATRAFAALHEGLTGEDAVKFPVKKFGGVLRTNGITETKERLSAICDSYKQFGCQMDDIDSAMLGQVYQRESQTGFNDAGWYIQAGNYARFLEQIDADNTSQGYFRIGGQITATSLKYARFGRGLLHEAGKTGLYFKLTDGFFDTIPVGILSFHIIWYDKSPGTWQFEYTNKSGTKKLGITVVAWGDGTWKDIQFVVDDAAMSHTHTRGSDFCIVSSSKTDLIFHMVEVLRGKSLDFQNLTTAVVPVVLPKTTAAPGPGVASFASFCSPGYAALSIPILGPLMSLLGA